MFCHVPIFEKNDNMIVASSAWTRQDQICMEVLRRSLRRFPSLTPDTTLLDKIPEYSSDIQSGYKQLWNTGLITDPFIEVSMGLAILGFVPFSITKRTEKGRSFIANPCSALEL